MKKLILLLLILSSSTFSKTYAQFGYGKLEDVQQIKKVPLMVVLLSGEPKKIKKLSKKNDGRLEQYLTDIEAYNANLRKAFENSWTFSEEVRFITAEELEKFNNKKNKRRYAYFKQLIDRGDISYMFDHKGAITTFNYAIYLTGKRKPVYSFMFSTLQPSEADFKLISQQIQTYLNTRETIKTKEKTRKEVLAEINASAPLLKTKTLLVEEENLSKDVLKSFAELYKYPYKIATKEEIEKAILTDSKDVAYLKILPVGQISDKSGVLKTSSLIFMQYVINAENGQYLAYVNPSPIRLPGIAGLLVNDNNNKLKRNDLLTIVKAIEKGEPEKQ